MGIVTRLPLWYILIYYTVGSCHILLVLYITTFEKKHVVLSMHNISGYVMAILRNIKFILYEKKKLKSPKIRKAIWGPQIS